MGVIASNAYSFPTSQDTDGGVPCFPSVGFSAAFCVLGTPQALNDTNNKFTHTNRFAAISRIASNPTREHRLQWANVVSQINDAIFLSSNSTSIGGVPSFNDFMCEVLSGYNTIRELDKSPA
jgi:hypothetical protein